MGNNGGTPTPEECQDDSCTALIGPEPNFFLDSCDIDEGAAYYVPGMCIRAFNNQVGAYTMQSYTYNIYEDKCNQLGDVPGEWLTSDSEYRSADDTYFFYTGNPYQIFDCSSDTCNQYKTHRQDGDWYDPGNCCNEMEGSCSECKPGWGCSTGGATLPCIRGNPLGNPLLCCFNDMNGTNQRSACYADNGTRGTCNKCQRDITSNADQQVSMFSYTNGIPTGESLISCSSEGVSGCQDLAFDYCIGDDLPANDTSWIYRWMNQDGTAKAYELDNPSCHYALLRNAGVPSPTIIAGLNTPSTGNCLPQPIISPDPEDIRWSQRLLNTALAKLKRQGYTVPVPVGSPGYTLFQKFLKENVCCRYPVICQQGLEAACRNQTLETVGQSEEIADWCGCYLPDAQYQEYVDNFGINKTCTPPCNRASSIKRVTPDNAYIPCTQGVCIIDNVTINIANSTGGDINFDQFCSNCEGGNCSCLIEDTSITVANSQFGEIAIQEKCGTIECTNEYGDIHPCVEDSGIFLWWNLFYIFLAIIIVVVFIILCIYLITLQQPSKRIVIKKKSPSPTVPVGT